MFDENSDQSALEQKANVQLRGQQITFDFDDVMSQRDEIIAILAKRDAVLDERDRIFIRLSGKLVSPGDWVKRRAVLRPPGVFLNRIAEFLYSRKTRASVIEPLIADMQFEYFEALSQNNPNKAKWIQIRESIRLFYILGVHRVLKAVAGLFSHAKMLQ